MSISYCIYEMEIIPPTITCFIKEINAFLKNGSAL